MTSTTGTFSLLAAESQEPIKLSLQRLWVTGQILPAGAHLKVQHVIRSSETRPLEVIYAFALPRDAALRSFRISGDTFEVHSELRDTEKAVETYEQAMATGALAALTRQYGDGVVNLTVGNIRPDETVTIDLEVLAGVELRDDGFRFRFPFTLAPRYHARARMVDGEMELPADEFGDVILPPVRKDATGLHEVGFDLSVMSQLAMDEIGSPSHALRVRYEGIHGSRVVLAQKSDLPDRDLVLDARFKTAEPQVLAGNRHFAAIIPSTAFGQGADTARRVTILLDRSGSMSGVPLEQAVKAIKACLSVLSENDNFGLVAFDNQIETFQPNLVSGNRENRDKAHDFLANIEARGGTELASGFLAASQMLGEQGGDVLIMTDGQVSGTEAILARARTTNTRLHCLGIGSASQDRFLALLARETGGVSRFVTPRERVDMCALDLFASVGRPVASGLKVDGNVQPQPPATVMAGTPVVLFGEGADQIHVTWDDGELRLPISYGDAGIGDTVRLLQGSRLITDWDSRYPSTEAVLPLEKRKQSRIASRLRELSFEYGLASREASLVAVVKRHGDLPGELPETRVVPVGMPQDTPFDAYFGASKILRGAQKSSGQAPTFDALFCMAPGDMSAAKASAIMAHLQSNMGPVGTEEPPELASRSGGKLERGDEVTRKSTSDDVEDVLLEVAARIEPDGGMPGKDLDARICSSVAALLAFRSQGHTARTGAFRSHVARLITFLKSMRTLTPEQSVVIMSVLKLIDTPLVPSNHWVRLARSPDTSWEQVKTAIASYSDRV